MIAYEYVTDPERLGQIANEINDAAVVGLDIETTGLSPIHHKLRLVQINTGRGVYVVDIFQTKTLGPVVDALRDGGAIVAIHNAKFEQKWLLYNYCLELWPLFDTFRASAILHNGRDLGHNLYDLYHRELGVIPATRDMGGTDWSGPLTEEQLTYAAEDVTYLHRLRDKLKPQLAKAGLNQIALLEFGAILPESEIELNGFRVDRDMWLALAKDNKRKLEKIKAELDLMMPNPKGQLALPGLSPGFNYGSVPQVLASFARLGIHPKDPTGKSSTAAETLAMIAAQYPVVRRFMEYRKVEKLIDSFGPKWLRHIDKKTGRVHTDFWPFTGCGRYSSGSPNLQQIPRSFEFRDCFRPEPGYVIIVCDYSQIELRIAAEMTGDRTLRAIYLRGEDAHRRTASIISGTPLDKVTKHQRQSAKPVNFGLIYGMGAERLVVYALKEYGVAITLAESKKTRQRYFDGYPQVRSWQDQVLRDGARTRRAQTVWGRYRFLDPNKHHSEFYNTPVQGTGADGLKRALRNVYSRLKPYGRDNVRMVHMVHDEIVLQVKNDPLLIEAVTPEIEEGMVEGIQPMIKSVPVVASADIGPSWAAH